MNVPPTHHESGWITYLKTIVVALPSLIFWSLTCVFVLPKLKEVCTASHTDFPVLITMALTMSESFKDNLLLGATILAAALILLEWKSKSWPRYRRLVFGLLAYAFNVTTLAVLTALVVMAVIAGASLMPPK